MDTLNISRYEVLDAIKTLYKSKLNIYKCKENHGFYKTMDR